MARFADGLGPRKGQGGTTLQASRVVLCSHSGDIFPRFHSVSCPVIRKEQHAGRSEEGLASSPPWN